MTFKKIFILFSLLFSINTYGNVDILLLRTPENKLKVSLKPHENFNGMVSSLVFTIKWSYSVSSHLGAIHQEGVEQAYLPISRSGGEQLIGDSVYQIFVGFGMTPMTWLDTEWVAEKEYVVAVIDIEGSGDFTLINDQWTGENNADYYLALGGADKTGLIYNEDNNILLISKPEENKISVNPNPTMDYLTVTFSNKPNNLLIKLFDPMGRIIETHYSYLGEKEYLINTSDLRKGVYFLEIFNDAKLSISKITKL